MLLTKQQCKNYHLHKIIYFQAKQYSKTPIQVTKGLASSFGFKKPTQTNKIRPISAPVKMSDSYGLKMLPKPQEKCPRSIPKSNTPSPNRFVS
jgi:hypothetical protein